MSHPNVVPRRPSQRELAELTQHHAARFLAGDYPFVVFDEDRRWHSRIYRDDTAELWLLTWLPTQATELHDHAGSSGAFTVVQGELTEFIGRTRGGGAVLTSRRRRSVSTTVFGPERVHDVVNRGRLPAVSVHAYSPPLTAMRFYAAVDGRLVVTRTVRTDDPEPVGEWISHRERRPASVGSDPSFR